MQTEDSSNGGWLRDIIPAELVARPQWVSWRYVRRGSGKKPSKKPHTPGTGQDANPADATTGRTYDDAQSYSVEYGMNGIGFIISAQDPYCGIDLDGCLDPETGRLSPGAQAIVDRFQTYTEVSPSGTGVKLWLRARKPKGRHKLNFAPGKAIEVYDQGRYFTVTGMHVPGTPLTIEDRQDVLDAWYARRFGAPAQQSEPLARPSLLVPSTTESAESAESASDVPYTLPDDAELIERAMRAMNGAKFTRLWSADDTDAHGDTSSGDLMLCRMLAFWTGKDAAHIDRLFRQSARYADPDRAVKWDRVHFSDGVTYGEKTIARAIEAQEEVYEPGAAGKREDRRTTIPQSWQTAQEDPQDREKQRRRLSAQLAQHVRAHLAAPDGSLLVMTAPPGSGKSMKVSEIGMDRNIAYFGERHNITESVEALAYFHHLQAPSPDTCPYYAQHAQYVALHYNTYQWHQQHRCEYARQFERTGSTLYMVEHAATPYPAKHPDGIIVDELSLQKWLPEEQFTGPQIRQTFSAMARGSVEAQLLRAVDEVLLRTAQDAGAAPYPAPLAGRALLQALDEACEGRLRGIVAELVEKAELLTPRRTLTDELVGKPESLVPNVVPHLLTALRHELPQWTQDSTSGEQDEKDWNGALRLAKVRVKGNLHKEWVLGITERRRFHADASPARALLDATADAETLRQLFETDVRIVPEVVTPPPHMRHLHLPVRYGVSSMRAGHGRDRERAVAQLKYLLRELDPARERTVALITHKEVVGKVGEALNIPAERWGWFFAERGSNKKQDADILLVVGTPSIPPDEVVRMARALYAQDPSPIDPRSEEVDGVRHSLDPRVQHLSETLTNAELTQCAHRNRPLWHDGRVVVTFCQGIIDHLPITQQIDALPQLDEDGYRMDVRREAEREERCRRELERFLTKGMWPTREQLRRETGLGQQYVSQWMREQEAAGVKEAFEERRGA